MEELKDIDPAIAQLVAEIPVAGVLLFGDNGVARAECLEKQAESQVRADRRGGQLQGVPAPSAVWEAIGGNVLFSMTRHSRISRRTADSASLRHGAGYGE